MLCVNTDFYKDNKNIEPVAVIAAYEKSGNFYPLYFSHHGCRLKVDNVRESSSNHVWARFWVEITFVDRVQQVELLYKFDDHLWFLRVPFGSRTQLTEDEKALKIYMEKTGL